MTTPPQRSSGRPSAPPGGGKRRLPMEPQTREHQPSPWGKRLVRLVAVRVGDGVRGLYEAPRGVFSPGTTVLVRGPGAASTGVVLGHATLVLDPPRIDGVIAGIATEGDAKREAKLRAREQVVARIGRTVVRDLDLPAKVVRAEADAGGNHFSLLLCTDQRLDFRTILRTLGQRTRERVELKVIGDRDAAKLIGGVGPCGLQLCCSTFLENFAPVGMRMAREQGLALNPERVNGVCGRLLCCLVYEDAAYRAARAAVPKLGDVRTLEGEAFTVTGVDVLEGRVQLRSSQGVVRTVTVEALPAAAQRPEGSEVTEPSAKSPR